jgi:hypothetical protein
LSAAWRSATIDEIAEKKTDREEKAFIVDTSIGPPQRQAHWPTPRRQPKQGGPGFG